MKSNHDISSPVPLTTTGDLTTDETVRAVLQRRGNLVHLRVEDAAGHTMQFSLPLSTILAKLTRHGGEVIPGRRVVGENRRGAVTRLPREKRVRPTRRTRSLFLASASAAKPVVPSHGRSSPTPSPRRSRRGGDARWAHRGNRDRKALSLSPDFTEALRQTCRHLARFTGERNQYLLY
jgi:hypothetical protein